MSDNFEGSWGEWQKHVLGQLEALNKRFELTDNKLDTIKAWQQDELRTVAVDIAKLQVKAGVWGAVGGLIPVAIILIVKFVGQ